MKYLLLIFIFSISLEIKASQESIFEKIISNNSSVKQYYYNYLKAKSDGKIESSNYLPQIGAEYNNYKSEYDKTSSNLKDSYIISSYNISFTQKLYELGALKKLDAAKFKEQQLYLVLQDLVANLFLELISLSLNILTEENYLEFLEAELKLLQEIKAITDLKFNNGSATKLDFLQAQTEYLKLQTDILEQEKKIKNLSFQFKKLTGVEYYKNNFTVENIAIPEYEVFAENIKKNNLVLKIAEFNNKILKLKSEISYKNIAPNIDLYINYDKSEGGFSYMSNSTKANSHMVYGVSVAVPLFNSGKNLANISSAKQEYLANTYLLEDHIKILDYDIYVLWQEILVAKQKITTQKEYLSFSKKALDAAETNYKFGKTDLLNLLEAQNLNQAAKYDLIKAENNLIISKYKYLQLSGNLIKDYLKIKLDSILEKL